MSPSSHKNTTEASCRLRIDSVCIARSIIFPSHCAVGSSGRPQHFQSDAAGKESLWLAASCRRWAHVNCGWKRWRSPPRPPFALHSLTHLPPQSQRGRKTFKVFVCPGCNSLLTCSKEFRTTAVWGLSCNIQLVKLNEIKGSATNPIWMKIRCTGSQD